MKNFYQLSCTHVQNVTTLIRWFCDRRGYAYSIVSQPRNGHFKQIETQSNDPDFLGHCLITNNFQLGWFSGAVNSKGQPFVPVIVHSESPRSIETEFVNDYCCMLASLTYLQIAVFALDLESKADGLKNVSASKISKTFGRTEFVNPASTEAYCERHIRRAKVTVRELRCLWENKIHRRP